MRQQVRPLHREAYSCFSAKACKVITWAAVTTLATSTVDAASRRECSARQKLLTRRLRQGGKVSAYSDYENVQRQQELQCR